MKLGSGVGDRQGSPPSLQDTSYFGSPHPVPFSLPCERCVLGGNPNALEEEEVCTRGGGESKCIWLQLYLSKWVAIRLDCVTLGYVTRGSSAQDKSVRPGTHASSLPT